MLKYWICKRAPMHAAEALECLGGNGYVEESGLPRLFRESPLNSIWEGSGNVQCLDVLRAMIKSPASLDAFFAEVEEGAAAEPRLDAYAAALRDELPGDVETIEPRARRVVERMALALQGSLLVRYGDEAVADAFCASRLAGDWGQAFGTLPAGTDFAPHHRPPPRRCPERDSALSRAADRAGDGSTRRPSRFALEAPTGHAGQLDTGELQVLVTAPVLLERCARPVGRVDVDFDREERKLGPVDVELATGDDEGSSWGAATQPARSSFQGFRRSKPERVKAGWLDRRRARASRKAPGVLGCGKQPSRQSARSKTPSSSVRSNQRRAQSSETHGRARSSAVRATEVTGIPCSKVRSASMRVPRAMNPHRPTALARNGRGHVHPGSAWRAIRPSSHPAEKWLKGSARGPLTKNPSQALPVQTRGACGLLHRRPDGVDADVPPLSLGGT